MLVYKRIEYRNCLYEFCMGLTVVCSTRMYVWYLSSSKYFRLFRLYLWQQVHVNSSKKVNINTSYSLHLSFSWGTSNFLFVWRMSSSNLFMSHLESTCSQLFLTIESQKVKFHMECPFLHTSHVCFIRKNLYIQQITFFFCNTCNYLKTVICNAFRYFMTVCAHSVVLPQKRWPIHVCQVYVLLASSVPFLRCSWLYFNCPHILMTK
jgi:hypothetical protein